MQTETTATAVTESTAPIVDVNPTPAPAPASAEPEVTDVDPSTTTEDKDDGSKQQEEDATADKGRSKSGTQKRIDELVFKRNEAQREAAHWKSIAEGRQQPAAPKSHEFDTDEEYQAALLDHRVDTTVNKRLAAEAVSTADRFTQEAQRAANETYNQRVADAVSRIPDFAAVVTKADIQISNDLQEALRDSEAGPDIVYHLAKNPAEAERLSQLGTRQLDREIGRLEVSLKAQAAKAPPAARTTNAPPPPSRPGTAASAPPNTDPGKMTMAEYETWRKSNGARYIK